MSYLKHFEKELKELRKGLEKGDSLLIEPFIPEITAICNRASEQGWSGAVAPTIIAHIAHVIDKVLNFMPVSGVTNNDDDYYEFREGLLFHKRTSSICKNSKGERPKYLNAVIFKDIETGYTYATGKLKTNKGILTSYPIIKKFPFYPETFIVELSNQTVPPTVVNEDIIDKIKELYILNKD